jgi:hypothetical protein
MAPYLGIKTNACSRSAPLRIESLPERSAAQSLK